MPRRRGVRLALALAAGALALSGLAACSSDGGDGPAETLAPVRFEFSGDAATVDGVAIPARVVADVLDVFRASPGALQASYQQTELNQAGSDQPQPFIVADLVEAEIKVKLIEAEIARRGIAIEAGDEQVGATQINATFGDSLAEHPELKQLLISRYAEYVALDMDLNGPGPDEATLRAAYDEDPARFDQACVSHILVADETAADSLLAQLRAGADFAELARSSSTDEGSAAEGGNLGCQARGVFVDALEQAVWQGPVGEVQGPIRTDGGYHVVFVSERGGRPFEDPLVQQELAAELGQAPFTALSDWLEQALAAAVITVDARFGTWDPETGKVIPVGVAGGGLQLGPATTAAAGGS